MPIYIDEFEDSSLPSGKNMKETIQAVQEKTNKVVYSIRIDGRELSEEEQDALLDAPISDELRVDFATAHTHELAEQTIATLMNYTDYIEKDCSLCCQNLQDKNYILGEAHFMKVLEELDLWVQGLSAIKQLLKLHSHQEFLLGEALLAAIMQDLLEAKQTQNWILQIDLLTKDLPEILGRWRNQIFPDLKNQLE